MTREGRGFYSDRDRFGRRIVRPITSAVAAGARYPKVKLVRFNNREEAEHHIESLSDRETEDHLTEDHGIPEREVFFKDPSKPVAQRTSPIERHRHLHGFLIGRPNVAKDTYQEVVAHREREAREAQAREHQFSHKLGEEFDRSKISGRKREGMGYGSLQK